MSAEVRRDPAESIAVVTQLVTQTVITGRARLGIVLATAPSSLSVAPLTIVRMDPGPAPPASSPAATRTMKANRRRDTLPELRVRRTLHGLGLRFIVDVPVPGTSRRRREDVLLRGARIGPYIDGCFWRSCPEHQHLPGRIASGGSASWTRSSSTTSTPTLPCTQSAGGHCGSGSTKIPCGREVDRSPRERSPVGRGTSNRLAAARPIPSGVVGILGAPEPVGPSEQWSTERHGQRLARIRCVPTARAPVVRCGRGVPPS